MHDRDTIWIDTAEYRSRPQRMLRVTANVVLLMGVFLYLPASSILYAEEAIPAGALGVAHLMLGIKLGERSNAARLATMVLWLLMIFLFVMAIVTGPLFQPRDVDAGLSSTFRDSPLVTERTWLPVLLCGMHVLLYHLLAHPVTRSECMKSRWIRRLERGYCPICNYNLIGNLSGVCPECGSEARYDKHTHGCAIPRSMYSARRTFAVALLVIVVAAGVMVGALPDILLSL